MGRTGTKAGVARTSVFEVCGSPSDSRFRIQGQTGNRQRAAADLLRGAHAAIMVHVGPLPGIGNLRRVSRRSVANRTSQAADLEGGDALPCLFFRSTPSSLPLPERSKPKMTAWLTSAWMSRLPTQPSPCRSAAWRVRGFRFRRNACRKRTPCLLTNGRE